MEETRTGGAPQAPRSETDCSRLLDRLKEADQQMRVEILRLGTATKLLYSPSEDKSGSKSAKQEEGWVGDMDTALNRIELLVSEFRAKLDWLSKLTGC